MARRPRRSHNGGPPLDDYDGPPWGQGDAYIFLAWQAAHAKAWKAPSRDVMLMRLERAERLGLLAELLVETVAGGGSVSFMHPLAQDAAEAFWRKSLAAAARGERVVLGAWDSEVLAGTVTLLLDFPPNQPHRAEIAKLMTRLDRRGQGVATRLMRAAEDIAVERSRTLLVLDTASEEGASGLYEKLGFTLTGEIPDFALKPHGGLTGTLIYWKRIDASLQSVDSGEA